MNEASGILRYLRDCYRENGSRAGILSLESSRVRRSLFIEGRDAVVSESVLEGQVFVPGKRAATLATQSRLYEKDRELYYGSVFLIGKVEGEEARRRSAFAPLILYSASVEQVMPESGAEFVIEMDRRILNYALLESLGDSEFVARVENAVDRAAHSESCVTELAGILEEQLPDLDRELLISYPELRDDRELKDCLEKADRDGRIHLASGAVLFLADKSTEMRGVLNDLEEMAEFSSCSAPVATLLGLPLPASSARKKMGFRGYVPAILSAAQEKIVESSHGYPVTLAIGPPGTGKSFTIAALAIEAMSRGESVLVCSKMDHAVDVVADKIEQSLDLRGVCVRAGRKSYLKELKSFLENLLSGLFAQEENTAKRVIESDRGLKGLRKRIAREESRLERRCRVEEKRGEILSVPEPGFLTRWRQSRYRKQAREEVLVSQSAERVTDAIAEKIDRTVEHLRLVRSFFLHQTLLQDRKTFQSFSKGIRARTSHKKEEYFHSVKWESLFQALPIWLCNLSDLHRVLPLRREIFDLVIIDEASQCDIASVLPALARARRAVITGDPKQLRHVSFLPIARQRELAEQHGLSEEKQTRFDFRNTSLVDLTSDLLTNQERIIFLNEHFRSRPDIIAFSNREFYSDRLAIMTGHRLIDRHGAPPLTLFSMEGRRGEDGVNEVEVDRILEAVQVLAEEGGPVRSIGILSPFRAQVEAIRKRIEQSSNALVLLERHDLLVGTSHSFQGEERDVMFLSLALDEKSPSASFRYLEKEDVFNVAITRARLENRVFVSFRKERGSGLVSRFLDHVSVHSGASDDCTRSGEQREAGGSDPALRTEVGRLLAGRGFEVREAFEIGGYSVDLLISRGKQSIGVDLIGFAGRFAEAMSLERHLALGRAGIRLFPLSLLEWEVKKEEIVDTIERWLAQETRS